MQIRVYRTPDKTTLNNAIKQAVAECQRDHGVVPSAIGVRLEDIAALSSIAGIPIQVSTSGIVLHAGEFELLIAESVVMPAAPVVSAEVFQQSLF